MIHAVYVCSMACGILSTSRSARAITSWFGCSSSACRRCWMDCWTWP